MSSVAPQHPANVREFARRLATDFDRTPSEIQGILRDRGYKRVPGWATIASWVDPEYRTRRLARARKLHAERRGGDVKRTSARRGWHYRLERMQTLRSLGISYPAIAALMSHDFDLELTEPQVRSIFNGQTSQRTVRKLLWPESTTPERSTS